MEEFDVIVVGAGPGGLLAAGSAAEQGSRVLVLEKMRQEGRKLLITGKGRCNITNSAAPDEFIKRIHPQGRFLKNAFSTYFSKDILALLGRYGVETTFERGGRYFPVSNKSADVLKALLTWLRESGVDIRCGFRVEKLLIEEGSIRGVQANGKGYHSQKVILATGGKSYPATGSSGEGFDLARTAGHTITALRPSLVPLETEGGISQQL